MLAGAFAIRGAIMKFREAISFGSQMSDLATRTSTTVREFMIWRDVARDAGVEVSVLERALRNVNIRFQEAKDGTKSYADAFKRLGVDMEVFNNLGTSDRLVAIARAFHLATDKTAAFADVADVLGVRAGPQLVEVLNKVGKDGFEAVGESAVVMSDQMAQELDRAEDHVQRFKDRVIIAFGKVVAAWTQAQADMGYVKEVQQELGPSREKAMQEMQRQLTERGGGEFFDWEKKALRNIKTPTHKIHEIEKRRGFERNTLRDLTVDFMRDDPKLQKKRKDAEESRKNEDKEREAAKKKREEAEKQIAMDELQEEIAKERQKLLDQITSDEEKLTNLVKERAALEDQIADDTVKGLEAKKKALELELEIAKIQPKVDADHNKARKELADKEQQLADLQEENRFDLLSDEEQLADLQRKQKKEQEKANFLAEVGNRKGEVEARIRAQELEQEIRAKQEDILGKEDEKPGLPVLQTSGIQAIAGGGTAAAIVIDPALVVAQAQLDALNVIAANTGKSANEPQKDDPKPVL